MSMRDGKAMDFKKELAQLISKYEYDLSLELIFSLVADVVKDYDSKHI
jgi:hypothetical protein